MIRNTTRIALFAATVVLGAGCRQVEESENPVSDALSGVGATVDPDRGSTSVELSRVQFDDIPELDGFFFRNQRNESFSYRLGGGRRVGRFVYWGKSSERDVISRYLELMRKDPYNWSLETPSPHESGGRLIFVKPGSRCEISLSRERPASKDGLLVTIWVEST